MRPIGVWSKNINGDRTIAHNNALCNIFDARSVPKRGATSRKTDAKALGERKEWKSWLIETSDKAPPAVAVGGRNCSRNFLSPAARQRNLFINYVHAFLNLFQRKRVDDSVLRADELFKDPSKDSLCILLLAMRAISRELQRQTL